MKLRKDLIFAILATVCLTSILFLTVPIRSTPAAGEYDPWIDTNDDGIINYQDLYNLASRFGTSGTPINKTNLLLELQDRINSLNASVIEHEDDIEVLRTLTDTLNVLLLDLIPRVNALEAPESVTNEKLASQAIPFYYATGGGLDVHAASTTWEKMDDMSVSMTLNRESFVLIMFSTEARVDAATDSIMLRALVDLTVAEPDSSTLYFVPRDATEWASYSFIFYLPNVSAGPHEVTIEWRMLSGSTTGRVGADRTLTVIALPA